MKKPKGRPAYNPTAKDRHRVSVAAGGGMSHEEIALALQISRPTLEKHFEAELSQGAFARRFEILQAMHAAAKKGSVAAAKYFMATEPRNAVPPLPEQHAPAEGEAKAKPLGKKEQAQLDAVSAAKGTDWDDLLPGHATTVQ